MFRTFRLSLRFLIPLLVAMAGVAYVSIPLVESLLQRWFQRDLDIRAAFVARSLEEPLGALLESNNLPRIDAVLERATTDERLYALGLCDGDGRLVRKTRSLPASIDCGVRGRARNDSGIVLETPQGPLHVAVAQIKGAGDHAATLVMVHDMSFVQRRSEDTRKYIVLLFTFLGVAVAVISIAVAHLSWRGWVAGVRAMLRGEGILRPFAQPRPELQPLVADLRGLLRDMQNERREQDAMSVRWSPEALRQLLHDQYSGDEVILVANREPYIHMRTSHGVEVQRPASGLVTAVEPVMVACSGTWLAHGSGSADRESADAAGRIRVPPGDPAYTLRRIWLSEAEEKGYYYGFANEGLWPLCHIAHVRPVFRTDDWDHYHAVNEKFAAAVVQEANSDDPVVLIQDYHFALLPRMVRERLPRATIIAFWHIPWPNPESFGICPWRDEIIDGLLGSTILGFHTRYHCNNFLQTVDRFVEARIDYESSTVSFGGHLTQVESYPISIAWPSENSGDETIAAARSRIRGELGIDDAHLLGLGVDRLDYTKGIVERMRAVERLFELYPTWIGRFSFVQIAAPSRSSLDEYQRFEAQVRTTAAQINTRYGDGAWQPIRLLIEHHDAAAVREYYKASDVCMVTSLHDGMNLVAKEFVAARSDERGTLILSQFAGAARELHEALIVNPYHIEQVADALNRALSMPENEQRERMVSLRRLVREFSVYRWAGRMLLDAARLRRRERIAVRIGAGGDRT
ncbi:MAG: alpha,alpha-trehalose-phosphate synthase (UDP-forming) [Burkholderiaceae bacterium]